MIAAAAWMGLFPALRKAGLVPVDESAAAQRRETGSQWDPDREAQ